MVRWLLFFFSNIRLSFPPQKLQLLLFLLNLGCIFQILDTNCDCTSIPRHCWSAKWCPGRIFVGTQTSPRRRAALHSTRLMRGPQTIFQLTTLSASKCMHSPILFILFWRDSSWRKDEPSVKLEEVTKGALANQGISGFVKGLCLDYTVRSVVCHLSLFIVN